MTINKVMYNKFNNIINEYDNINIYCHIQPDLDALGSSFGLKYLIETNFSNKIVSVICQEHNYKFMPQSDNLDETILDKSLAIILDVSKADRVYNQSFHKASKIIRIDHHPDEIEFTDYKISNSNSASTCEIIVDIAKVNKYKLDSKIASILYLGILSDTLAYKTNNTTKETLLAGAYLLDYDIDLVELNKKVFTSTYENYKLETFIRNKIIINEKFAYSIITNQELINNNTTTANAKNCVYLYGQLNNIEMYALFVENNDNKYDASLRSFKKPINDIAINYGGGGHLCASGIKNLTIEEVNTIINTMTQRSIKE